MANDSSTGGYLVPAPSGAPPYGDPLENILQGVVAGITGIDPSLIRPRWQPEPPNMPSFSTNWVAFGIVRFKRDTFVYEQHEALGQGDSYVERDEQCFVLHSFYGPNCHEICMQYADGVMLAQNREVLITNNINLVEVQEPVNLPQLLKEKWVKRIDLTVVFRRRVHRTFPILNVQSAQITVGVESIQTSVTVNP